MPIPAIAALALIIIAISSVLIFFATLHKRRLRREELARAHYLLEMRAILDRNQNGLVASARNSIPKVPFEDLPLKGEEGEEPQCTVCLLEYRKGDLLDVLPCDHAFHTICLDEWLASHTTCPICRVSLGPATSESVRRGLAAATLFARHREEEEGMTSPDPPDEGGQPRHQQHGEGEGDVESLGEQTTRRAGQEGEAGECLVQGERERLSEDFQTHLYKGREEEDSCRGDVESGQVEAPYRAKAVHSSSSEGDVQEEGQVTVHVV
eukprot:TRINITY_DN32465_c0_g1_i1.p1 TRINITY_DN32465_c0_g1~~TRINITY_DN32465_c0_g1_i1.p1  ORF type:complete len:266 (-),score=46.70 TRINITY_DN32465_c0_g1_i1:397-1194(-)